MMIIIIGVVGFLLLGEKFSESSDYGFVADENSIWHDEYEKELENLYKKAEKKNITLSAKEINMVSMKVNRKAKVFERNLLKIFIFSCIFTVLCLKFGSYEKNEITKYDLLPIKDESILYGQPKEKIYYIAENVNKDNSYMFFYESEEGPKKMEIVADNIIKYENIDCKQCVVKEIKTSQLKYAWLHRILFFDFRDKIILSENYKFYAPKESYIKNFSY